jgi:hypothetical protein
MPRICDVVNGDGRTGRAGFVCELKVRIMAMASGSAVPDLLAGAYELLFACRLIFFTFVVAGS